MVFSVLLLIVDMGLLISCKHSDLMTVIAMHPMNTMEILTANLLIQYKNIIIQVSALMQKLEV